MKRLNPLTGELEQPEPSSFPKPKARKSTVAPVRRASSLLEIVRGIPLATFSFMLADAGADTEKIREGFLKFCGCHPEFTDWRKAWESFQHLNRGSEDRGEGATVQFNQSLQPYLSRIFPKNLRRVICARGPAEILAFNAALRGAGSFARKYEQPGYQPLSIEVLPPAMCPAGVPAVAVSHTFLQNGDLMRDPEIVFAVAEWDAWLPYEITQDPVGIYRCAYREGAIYPKIVGDMRGLVSAWAKNLIAQGWNDEPPGGGSVERKSVKRGAGMGPSVGAQIAAALGPQNIIQLPPAPPTAVESALSAIRGVEFPK